MEIYDNNELILRPILDNNLKDTGYVVDQNCNVYDFFGNNKTRFRNERPYVNLNLGNGNIGYSATRICLRAFECITMPMEMYKEYEVDHVNPSRPLSNNVKNLEWVSHQENMKRAGQTGVMIQKYNKDLINDICTMISNKVPRQEIMNTLNVNGQLVDDIRSGRSHKYISENYLDKGFEYKVFNKAERRELARQVCEMTNNGMTSTEITNILETPVCFANDVKAGRCYKDVSEKYLNK